MIADEHVAASPSLLVARAGRVAWVRLNRPEVMNAISNGMLRELEACLTSLAEEPDLCAVVLAGSPNAFSAGADLKEVENELAERIGQSSDTYATRLMHALLLVEQFPKPVIAAVQGWVLAGGLELVLCCDLVVAGEGARFGDAHAKYGLLPSGGASARLPERIGSMRAKQMMFTSDYFSAQQMYEFGLVTQVVPDGEVEAAASALADKLSQRSPLGLRRMKALLNSSTDAGKRTALRLEQLEWALHAESHDMNEGLAAFRAKRRPEFKGR